MPFGEWTLPVRYCGGIERESGITILLPYKKFLPKGDILEFVVEGFLGTYKFGWSDYFTGGFLPHGGRIYRDNTFFPEFSTPEVFSEKSLVGYDLAAMHFLQNEFKNPAANVEKRIKAGFVDPLIRLHVEAAPLDKSTGLMIMNSADSENNTWGMHENYLIPYNPEIFAENSRFFNCVASIAAIRQVISESGGLFKDMPSGQYEFLCSQRAPFYGAVFANLHYPKPIIMARDGRESSACLADGGNFTRIEILSDNNSLPSSLWLKIAFMSLALPAIFESFDDFKPICLYNPLQDMYKISRTILFQEPALIRADGKVFSISWYLQKYLEIIANYYAKKGRGHAGKKGWKDVPEIIQKISEVIGYIAKREFDALVGITDYVTNKHILDRLAKKGWDGGRLKAAEIFYHVVHPDYSLSHSYLDKSAGFVGIPSSAESLDALMNSPYEDSRAYERAMIIKFFFDNYKRIDADAKLSVDWTDIIYEKNNMHYTIVRKNPWDSNKKLVDEYLNAAQTFEEYCQLTKHLRRGQSMVPD